MRLSVSYRIVRSRGFFIGKRLFFYRRRFLGYALPAGTGVQPRQWWYALAEGSQGILTGLASAPVTPGYTRRKHLGMILMKQGLTVMF